jgi:hypothetical protein
MGLGVCRAILAQRTINPLTAQPHEHANLSDFEKEVQSVCHSPLSSLLTCLRLLVLWSPQDIRDLMTEMIDFLEASSLIASNFVRDIISPFSLASCVDEVEREIEEMDDHATTMTSIQDPLGGSDGINSLSKDNQSEDDDDDEAQGAAEDIPELYVNDDDGESEPTSLGHEVRLMHDSNDESEEDASKSDQAENESLAADDPPLNFDQNSVTSLLSSEKDPFGDSSEESDESDGNSDDDEEDDEEERDGHGDKVVELRSNVTEPLNTLDLWSYISGECQRAYENDLETIQNEAIHRFDQELSLLDDPSLVDQIPGLYAQTLIPLLTSSLLEKMIQYTYSYQTQSKPSPPLLTPASSFRKREGVMYKRASFGGTGRLLISGGESGTYTMETEKAIAASGNLAENETKAMTLCIFDILFEALSTLEEEASVSRREIMNLGQCSVTVTVTYNHTVKIVNYPSDDHFSDQSISTPLRRRRYQLSGDSNSRRRQKGQWIQECIWSKLHLKDPSWRNIEIRNYQVWNSPTLAHCCSNSPHPFSPLLLETKFPILLHSRERQTISPLRSSDSLSRSSHCSICRLPLTTSNRDSLCKVFQLHRVFPSHLFTATHLLFTPSIFSNSL